MSKHASPAPMLTRDQLAERWGFTRKTLDNWECDGSMPIRCVRFGKKGGRVRYRLADVEAHEAKATRP